MILVIGGSFQGKKEFVQRNLVPSGTARWCDGALASWEEVMESPYICNLHFFVRRVLAEREKRQAVLMEDLMEELWKGLSGSPLARILVTDEVGCGIIPLDEGERLWREASGRLNCRLAAQADQVWRVCCGLGTRVK